MTLRSTRYLCAAVAVCTLIATSAVSATEIYIPSGSLQSGVTVTNQGGEVAGSLFTALSPITFHSLGFLDLSAAQPTLLGPDGIVGTYQVGIWDFNTQALLASATVTPASPLGPNFSQFRYAPIPATTIVANQKIIVGALLPAGPTPDAWLDNAINVNSPSFTGPGSGYILPGTTLSFPTQAAFQIYAVANASTEFVPEPATAGMLIVTAGLAMFARRRREVATCT
jgi:hypothetical protein